VAAFESEWQLPAHLVYAVMRQESGFQPGALSPVSAVGLMQLMPRTAARAAGEIGLDYEFSELARPATNIRLGAYYLGRVLGTFGAQVPLAAAAYNAGPVVVSQWLGSAEHLPLDLFVARIPYRETRTYVARVVGNWARYVYLAEGLSAVPSMSLDIPRGLRAAPDAY
jgi:soluble lytic murein transglycosylase